MTIPNPAAMPMDFQGLMCTNSSVACPTNFAFLIAKD
jgi:hypothetical protein